MYIYIPKYNPFISTVLLVDMFSAMQNCTCDSHYMSTSWNYSS